MWILGWLPAIERSTGDLLLRLPSPKPPQAAPVAAVLEDHTWPGNVRELEKGRLRALFGSEEDTGVSFGERLVTTPSAVLAVRGTEYGIEVAKNGDTSVVVFEGVVEVKDIDGLGEPVMVRHGESCRIRLGTSPSAPPPHGLNAGDNLSVTYALTKCSDPEMAALSLTDDTGLTVQLRDPQTGFPIAGSRRGAPG